MDRIDRHRALGVAEHNRAEHDFFGQLHGFGFDHQHSRFGTSDHEVHDRIFARGLAGVEHIFAVDVTHAGRADRAGKGHAADAQRRADRDHGCDVGVHFGVERQGVHHDVHFIEKTFREQRADRAVDQAAGQRLEFAGAAFALEEAAGDLARSVAFLQVIHRQGEKVLAGFAFGARDYGGQHHGAVHVEHHCASGLAGDFAGFHGDRVLAPLKGLANFIEHRHRNISVCMGGAGHLTQARNPHHRTRCHSKETRLWGRMDCLGMTQLRSVFAGSEVKNA